jgi:hypothetical protein
MTMALVIFYIIYLNDVLPDAPLTLVNVEADLYVQPYDCIRTNFFLLKSGRF